VGDRERRLDSGEEGREGGLADAMVSGRGRKWPAGETMKAGKGANLEALRSSRSWSGRIVE
jgi:hypothetical protein